MPERDVQLITGDCVAALKKMEPCSVDSIVTDPPYEIGFMNKAWDGSGIAFRKETWEEALRVLKPGGHMLVFGFSRNYHRLACAIEDAGFEVRDCIMWIYGSGFPKSLDVSKAIDKAAGAKREVVGPGRWAGREAEPSSTENWGLRHEKPRQSTTPSTPHAQQWDGWGTALKPAYEPIMVARKPLEGTVAANVLEHGVGGINVEACRIGTSEDLSGGRYSENATGEDGSAHGAGINKRSTGDYQQPAGRWPANVILDEEAGEALDAQSGERPSGGGQKDNHKVNTSWFVGDQVSQTEYVSSSGGASRFFYCAKASKKERDAGLEDFEERRGGPERLNAAARDGVGEERMITRRNTHPTVKPLKLMRYLCELVTPLGGVILDPFMGSGSTGVAAVTDGYRFIGVEMNADYLDIARARIEGAQAGE